MMLLTHNTFGWISAFLPVLVLSVDGSLSTSSINCVALSLLLPGKVSFPTSPNYLASIQSYFWLQGEELKPACIATPTCTSDVALLVGELTISHSVKSGPLFALRSGGHSPIAMASNGNGLITIDLSSLDAVNVAADKTVASVGAGAQWQNVYSKLDPLGRAVQGGRVAGIGVGGFLSGGE
jgi:FAD/FMN-containing dehydrogenase